MEQLYLFELEEWRDIDGYDGMYQVSNKGRVRSLNYMHTNRLHVLKPHKHENGYLSVMLYNNSKSAEYLIHRIVAMAFIPNPENLPQVNHRNENKSDNSADNLEWCTAKYNTNYGNARRCLEAIKKHVVQTDLNGRFIRSYESAKHVEQYGFSKECVYKCCRGITKQHRGYIWRYE